jgi:hypothetical protein
VNNIFNIAPLMNSDRITLPVLVSQRIINPSSPAVAIKLPFAEKSIVLILPVWPMGNLMIGNLLCDIAKKCKSITQIKMITGLVFGASIFGL